MSISNINSQNLAAYQAAQRLAAENSTPQPGIATRSGSPSHTQTHSANRTESQPQVGGQEGAAGARPSAVKNVDTAAVSTPIAQAYEAQRATLGQAQQGLARLQVTESALRDMTQGLDGLQRLFTRATGRGAGSVENRKALADQVAALDRRVRAARFDGESVFDGQARSVNLAGERVNLPVAQARLGQIPALLATGGAGVHALSLDSDAQVSASSQTLAVFSGLVGQALEQVSASRAALGEHLRSAQGSVTAQADIQLSAQAGQQMGQVSSSRVGQAAPVLGAGEFGSAGQARQVVAVVAEHAAAAVSAHFVSAEAANHLLQD